MNILKVLILVFSLMSFLTGIGQEERYVKLKSTMEIKGNHKEKQELPLKKSTTLRIVPTDSAKYSSKKICTTKVVGSTEPDRNKIRKQVVLTPRPVEDTIRMVPKIRRVEGVKDEKRKGKKVELKTILLSYEGN